MNWWHTFRNDPISARTALPSDRALVSALLAGMWRHHGSQALDDQATLLQSGLSCLALARQEAVGFLGLAARSAAVWPAEVWVDVSLVAIASKQAVDKTLGALVRQALPALQAGGCTGMICLTASDWLVEGLLRTGFTQTDQVISYVHDDPDRLPSPVEVAQFRPASTRDADTILALNAAAFAPIWRYSDATVISWLMAAERATVAYLQDEPVGFALTAIDSPGNYAHLIRIATHPNVHGRGVGRQLVVDGLHYAYGAGSPGLALNTQASNRISQRLYESLGFRRVDPTLAVLVHAV